MIKHLKNAVQPDIKSPDMARHGKGRLFSLRGKGGGIPLHRRIIILIPAGVVLLGIALVAGYYQLLAYLQSDAFRARTAETLCAAAGARQVDIAGNFSINGNRISNEGITITGMPQVRVARASGISAEIDRAALLGRRLHLHKLTMEDASLAFNSDGSPDVALPGLRPTPQKTGGKMNPRKKKAKKSSVPPPASELMLGGNKIELELFECRDANLHLTRNNKSYQLLNAGLTATPAPRIGEKAWQFNIESARFHSPFPYLKDSSIKSATVIYNDHGLDLTDCSILLTPGELRTRAHYDLDKNNWTTDLQVNKGNVDRILVEDWQKRVHGELYGRLLLTGKANQVTTGTGSLSLQNGILEGLPIISQLPIGNTFPYRSIDLEKAECQILFPYNSDKIQNAWLLDKIHVQAKDGILIIHGHVIIGADHRLSGTLTIGLPEKLLGNALVSHEAIAARLFTGHGEEPGYVWVNMNLSGTLEEPQEDLSIRVATLAGQNLGSLLETISSGGAGALLENLLNQPARTPATQTPDEQEKDNPSTLKSAADAADRLLRSFF